MSTTARPTRTLSIARALKADALDIQVVSLSRNFGKEAALMAGLDHARRGAVMFMDGDGQHPPELVEQLVATGSRAAMTWSIPRKPIATMNRSLRRLSVHGFYALINWGARQKIPEDAGDFRLLSPRAVAALRQLPERNRFFKGLASWIGFRQIRVDYEPAPRAHGVTTFNFMRLLGLSIEGLTSFSVAPLALCEPARRAFSRRAPSCSACRSCGRSSRPASRCPAIPRSWSA